MGYFMRATSAFEAVVPQLDRNLEVVGYRTLVIAAERGTWNIDNRPVNVVPGLIVGFADATGLSWFLERGRAIALKASSGQLLCFECEGDRDYLVSLRRGEIVSGKEAEAAASAA